MVGDSRQVSDEGDWSTVTRRKKRSPTLDPTAAALQRSLRTDARGARLESVKRELAASAWFRDTLGQLHAALGGRPVGALVCLGLGRVGRAGAARHQLACASLLAGGLRAETACIFDPVMDEGDEASAREGGMRVAGDERDFSVRGRKALVLFMPHCHWDLVAKVLGACSDRGVLEETVLLGNSLKREMASGPAEIVDFKEFCKSDAVSQTLCPDASTSSLYTAFNDLAVVRFFDRPAMHRP